MSPNSTSVPLLPLRTCVCICRGLVLELSESKMHGQAIQSKGNYYPDGANRPRVADWFDAILVGKDLGSSQNISQVMVSLQIDSTKNK